MILQFSQLFSLSILLTIFSQFLFGNFFSKMFKIDSSYHQTSNTRHTLEGNKIVDHSDVVGAVPVGATPTTSSFST